MVLKLVNKSNNDLPRYETELSAGMDVRSFIESPIILKPFERRLVNTGLYAQLEKGYEIQVRPRSGLALKKGITVLNSPGTIDADYRGEIGVILINLSGGGISGTKGTFAAFIPLLAKYIQVGVLEVLETPNNIISAFSNSFVF